MSDILSYSVDNPLLWFVTYHIVKNSELIMLLRCAPTPAGSENNNRTTGCIPARQIARILSTERNIPLPMPRGISSVIAGSTIVGMGRAFQLHGDHTFNFNPSMGS